MSGFGVEPRVGNGDVLDIAGITLREGGFDGRPFEALSDWLAAGWADGVSPHPEQGPSQTPATRLTLNRIYELADGTELRARTLAWMIEARGVTEVSSRKVQSLFQVAAELRQIAKRLSTVEGGTPPQAPHQPSSGDVRLTRDCDTVG